MILVSNITFQLGFSLELGKTFTEIGAKKSNYEKVLAIVPWDDKIRVFPLHNINSIIRKKYSYIPLDILQENRNYLTKKQQLNCFLNDNKIVSVVSGRVFHLQNTTSASGSNIPNDSIIIFNEAQKAKIDLIKNNNKNYYFISEKEYFNYLNFLSRMNSIHDRSQGAIDVVSNFTEQYVSFENKGDVTKYLVPSFFFNSSLLFRILIDSVGKSKEMSNFFVPITYEAFYIMFEVPLFSRILQYNSTLLNSDLLKELYRKYFLIKLGITTDIFGLSWSIDLKGLLDLPRKINKFTKMQILLLFLNALFRAFAFTIKQNFTTFYLTFDFYTYSFSISAVFFPIKYSAYIDKQGKKPGVEIKCSDSIQVTYY